MSDTVTDITVVGGGDVGLLTGLCLQKLNPEIDITIVDDFQQDIPDVGKSTYLAINSILHDTLEIDEERFISEVKPIWKASAYFKDWCGYPPFHYAFDVWRKFPNQDTPNLGEQYYYYYTDTYDNQDRRTKCEELVAQRKSPWYFSVRAGEYQQYPHTAYHLNTNRFNSFLRDLCTERGISLRNDRISTVETRGNHIDRIGSEREVYESDLYVDASGFTRVLRQELDSEFTEFGHPLDAAFVTQIDIPLADVVPATVIETGAYGWFWQIDTFDNRDFGYVFASDFVAEEEALAEFLEYCSGAVLENDVTTYRFTSGYHDRAWIENCITIGNAQGFVEPLHAPELTTNAQAAANLSNLLSAHGQRVDDGIRDSYNAWVQQSFESFYDFISLHYKYSSGENEFWQAMQSIDVSARVEYLIRAFDRNGFDTSIDPTKIADDIADLVIFRPRHFYFLIRQMGGTSEFYETNEFAVSDTVKREEDDYYQNVREEVANHITIEQFYKGTIAMKDGDVDATAKNIR